MLDVLFQLLSEFHLTRTSLACYIKLNCQRQRSKLITVNKAYTSPTRNLFGVDKGLITKDKTNGKNR